VALTHFVEFEVRRARQVPELRRFAVNKFRTIFNGNRLMRISVREDAPANAFASFDYDHFAAGLTEISGSGETRRTRADHENCVGIQAWLRLSTTFVRWGKISSATHGLSRSVRREMARGFVGDDA
jgi:hypothetical protein